ncbi:DUF4362 domain-containing protein [Geomicrobium sp. JCM 19039]|uniref:DUF4362 domain-containing protein n=1 Tax=Geomicrobium sp. JCM 19039 TaxID=1460636 RepID=UPI0006940076|nr:DUF4362 domain-containing protein [Geomicrobium sp. JCM 19039]
MNNKTGLSFFLIILLGGCRYTAKDAIENNEVVSGPGAAPEGENVHLLEEFIVNMELGESDKVRVTQFTDEGDPIFIDLVYENNGLEVTYNDRHDEYAKPYGTFTVTCEEIEANTQDNETSYRVIGCDHELETIGLIITEN